MSTMLERMSHLLEDFVQQEGQKEGVVGILVFGSFVRGDVRETSDLDILVLREDAEEYSRMRRREDGVLLEIHVWPLKLFCGPFLGKMGDPFSDAFSLGVMRVGRILYDPRGILQKFKDQAKTHRFPLSHIRSIAERAHRGLRLAEELLTRRELEGAELEIRRAAEDLARAVLLERDVLEIIPPKSYLPHLREEAPEFYSAFRTIHNLKNIRRETIAATLQLISEWRERTVEAILREGKKDWLRLGTAIRGAQTELSNARDCLESGDLEAAVLQARYSAVLVASPIFRLLRGKPADTRSDLYVELRQTGHPYVEVIRFVMEFSCDERRLRGHLAILKDVARRYR